MSKTREKSLWKWLSEAKKAHMDRIENAVGSGMPDVYGQATDGTRSLGFTIELKTQARAKRATTKLERLLDIEQVKWHEKRVDAGGHCYILIQVGGNKTARRYLVPGAYARSIFNRRYSESQLQKLLGQDGLWSQTEIIEHILDNYEQGFLRNA